MEENIEQDSLHSPAAAHKGSVWAPSAPQKAVAGRAQAAFSSLLQAATQTAPETVCRWWALVQGLGGLLQPQRLVTCSFPRVYLELWGGGGDSSRDVSTHSPVDSSPVSTTAPHSQPVGSDLERALVGSRALGSCWQGPPPRLHSSPLAGVGMSSSSSTPTLQPPYVGVNNWFNRSWVCGHASLGQHHPGPLHVLKHSQGLSPDKPLLCSSSIES